MPSDLIVCPGTHSGRRDVPQNDATRLIVLRSHPDDRSACASFKLRSEGMRPSPLIGTLTRHHRWQSNDFSHAEHSSSAHFL